MKFKGYSVIFTTCFSLLLGMAISCQPTIKHKVTFNPNYDDKESTVVEVKEGFTVSAPSDPTRLHYAFDGWRIDKEATSSKFDFSTKIYSDITLYGSWQLANYTVTFDPNDGSETSKQVIPAGETISDIPAPTRTDYTFDCWRVGESYTSSKFDFDTKIYKDMTLYGSWFKNSCKVTFDPDYDNEPTTYETVSGGSTISAPTSPTRSDAEFDGWRIEKSDSSTKFEFDKTIIRDDITLYGSWIEDYIVTVPTLKNPELYLINSYGTVYDYQTTFPMYLFNDTSIPYLSITLGVEYYLNYMSSAFGDKEYSYSTSNYITTITNPVNSSKCVIDYKKQTMSFEDYSAFHAYDPYQVTPIDCGFTGGRGNFVKIAKKNYYAPKEPLVINFKDYNIPIYCYNNEGYLPIHIFNNILCFYCVLNFTYIKSSNSLFVNNCSGSNQITANNVIQNAGLFTSFDQDYMNYCYNLLALTLDYRYGMRQRLSRASSGTITYPTSSYDILKTYESDLKSTSPGVSNTAINKIINLTYDDGGHTGYRGYGFSETSTITFDKGSEYNYTMSSLSNLTTPRSNKSLSPTKFIGSSDAIGYYNVLNYKDLDTAFLTFDSFTALDDEDEPTYESVDQSNYYKSVIGLVRYSDKQLRGNNNIKNLVIDLSLNTGGTVYTGLFISSWLCGGCTSLTANPLTGALSEVEYQADINNDGKFDENDKLPSSIENLYVITSPASFSCGNLLPTTLKDFHYNVKFIGSRSGGGACYVQSGLQTGLGSTYQVSSLVETVRKGSTQDNLISNDDGVGEIDYSLGLPTDTTIGATYYDRETIYDRIHA